jgi:hypothetical protein
MSTSIPFGADTDQGNNTPKSMKNYQLAPCYQRLHTSPGIKKPGITRFMIFIHSNQRYKACNRKNPIGILSPLVPLTGFAHW